MIKYKKEKVQHVEFDETIESIIRRGDEGSCCSESVVQNIVDNNYTYTQKTKKEGMKIKKTSWATHYSPVGRQRHYHHTIDLQYYIMIHTISTGVFITQDALMTLKYD